MAKEQSGDQTELPTQKRIKDARKEGQVNKSRDLTSTAIILTWIVLGWLVVPELGGRAIALFELSVSLFNNRCGGFRRPALAHDPAFAGGVLGHIDR
jgi:type III secretion protein U